MADFQLYQARRAELAQRLPEGSVALIPSAREILRNGDAHFRFRQDSDFYYLTGFVEPDSLLVIFAGEAAKSVLFNRAKDERMEQWTGPRLGQHDVPEELGINDAYPIDKLDHVLPELLIDAKSIYLPLGRYAFWDRRILACWNKLKKTTYKDSAMPEAFIDSTVILGEMRVIKDENELILMKKAADITVAAHQRAMRSAQKVAYEYQLEAEFNYEISRQGCRGYAYDPIVASGNNATILHYVANNNTIQSGDLVLIDAGAEFQHYAADVTRTFPVNGTFSGEQRAIYELVLKAQQTVFAMIKPGLRWDAMQKQTCRVLTEGLIELGLLQGQLDDLIKQQAYQRFYMHRVGHWLGLDVHDCGSYYDESNRSRNLVPGMVFTVEPGIYIAHGMKGVDPRWWGIGVRIEDDVCVTNEGYAVLSAALPTAVDEIEALIKDA